jgi:hypothetical protein
MTTMKATMEKKRIPSTRRPNAKNNRPLQRIIVRAKVKSTRTVAEVRVDVPVMKLFQSK